MIKGSKHSSETRAKISAAHARQVALFGEPHLGHRHSLEARIKMRIAGTGRVLNPEWRKKIGIAGISHVTSAETRTKISLARTGKAMGDKHPGWKGGQTACGGYEMIRVHPSFYIAVHRKNMEQILGRRLQKGEVVHHINRKRSDNRPENLSLCSDRAAHDWCATEEARVFFG